MVAQPIRNFDNRPLVVLILRLNLGIEMVSCHMLPMMASLCIFAISTVCRWGTEQPQSSFGVMFISLPMKIAGGHPPGSQGKSCILCV